MNESIFEKSKGDDVKINFDNTKLSRTEGSNAQFRLNLIAVYTVKSLDQEETLSRIKEYFDDDYLSSLFKNEEELKI